MNSQVRKKVFVGLSGGVDSSVTAALLKERGFDVTGVFIKVWSLDMARDKQLASNECSATEDRLDAMRVCAHLDIPFKTLDLSEVYKKEVVDYMISEYKRGSTPNPDVMCNRYVKFGAFWDWAEKEGADYIATGHYAINRQDEGESKYNLVRGVDSNKDQTYFLWTLTQTDLAHTLFPVGEYEKSAVRKMATRFGLPTATKKDSQGLCFIGHVDMQEFLSYFIETEKGCVLNKDGQEIGWHNGAVFFTLGQRHGFTVTKKTPQEHPYFVVGIDGKKNTITVSDTVEKQDVQTTYSLIGMVWRAVPKEEIVYGAHVRYRGSVYACTVRDTTIIFKEPVVVAKGQSIVVYDGDYCLGGGIVA